MEHTLGEKHAPKLVVNDPQNYMHIDFFDLPDALGWTVDYRGELRAIPSENTPFDDENQVIQIWLFFSLLNAIFQPLSAVEFDWSQFTAEHRIKDLTKNGKLEFDCQHFIHYQDIDAWIHTDCLNLYMEAWYFAEMGLGQGLIKQQDSRADMARVQRILSRAHKVVSNSCSARPAEPGRRSAWSHLNSKTLQCIMVLGETMQRAASAIMSELRFSDPNWFSHTDKFRGWGYEYHLLQDHCWGKMCPKDLHNLLGTLNQSTIGLLHAINNGLPRPPPNENHDLCSSTTCVVDERRAGRDPHASTQNLPHKASHPLPHYELRHMSKPCSCLTVGPQMEKVKNIIRNGAIPLLSISKCECSAAVVGTVNHCKSNQHHGSLFINVESWSSSQEGKLPGFVAFSHSWRHGFANLKDNKMHGCTLRFLSKVANDYASSAKILGGRESVPFWIDTLAIPISNSDDDRILRTKSMRTIPDVYRYAHATFALDKDLLDFSYTRFLHEATMKITTCHWMSRLWTLQEAFLSRKLIFVLKDGDLLDIEKIEKMFRDEKKTLVDWRSEVSREFYTNLLGPLRRELFGVDERTHQVSTSAVVQVMKAARSRQTTWMQHETIAYAMVLGFAGADRVLLSELERIQDNFPSSTSAEPRMIEFIRYLGSGFSRIPALLVFLPGRRLKKPEYSWAPASFMVPHHYSTDHDPALLNRSAALDSNGALRIKAPGVLLHRQDVTKATVKPFPASFTVYVACDRHSLVWYRISQPVKFHRLSRSTDMNGLSHRDEPLDEERHVFDHLSLELSYAVIALELPPRGPHSLAILVSVQGSSNGEYFVERLGNVSLEKIDPLETGRAKDAHVKFFGSVLSPDTVWSIRGYRGPQSS